MLETFARPEAWISLATLTALEIVLGIDNIIFITILAGKLPEPVQKKTRQIGLAFALITRLLLLLTLSWIMRLTAPLLTLFGASLSGRDLILLIGGLFLIGKATHEIHDKLEVQHGSTQQAGASRRVAWVVMQIVILDLVFSLDSVITAVGMTSEIPIMVVAMVLAVVIMMIFAGAVSSFVEMHPSIKILALSFLLLVGVMLTAEAFGQHVSKGYIYFAMAFSLVVEIINIQVRKRQQVPVHLHHKYESLS